MKRLADKYDLQDLTIYDMQEGGKIGWLIIYIIVE